MENTQTATAPRQLPLDACNEKATAQSKSAESTGGHIQRQMEGAASTLMVTQAERKLRGTAHK
jgi:hypothetical protein